MKPSTRSNIVILMALALLAAAGLLTSANQAVRKKLSSRTAMLQSLLTVQEGMKAERDALAAFQNLPPEGHVAIAELASAVLPPNSYEIKTREGQTIADGWETVSATVRTENSSLELISRLLERGSVMSPPWMLETISIRCDGAKPGHGKAVLEMTTLRRAEHTP